MKTFKKNDGYPIDKETIREWVEEGIKYLSNHEESEWYATSGNCFVHIYKSGMKSGYLENKFQINICRIETSSWLKTATEILDSLDEI